MGTSRLFAIILLVGGLAVLGIAYQQYACLAEHTKPFFTGDYSNKTTWMIAMGGVAGFLGFVGLLVPSRDAAAR
jgi:hypothetical protein